MTNYYRISIVLFLLCISMLFLSGCVKDNSSDKETVTQTNFKAVGNTDPDHRAPQGKQGEVVVTFDTVPVKLTFNLPCQVCLETENGIKYYNGWAETYDPAAGQGSCEPLMDEDNLYSRMWIESQNEARIVVRWRAALLGPLDKIAHAGSPQVCPYGPGDWVDEWYYIYPDGHHVRRSLVYTYFAKQSKTFGWDRLPPNYVHEFQEMLFMGDEKKVGNVPENEIHTEALTLMKLNGDFEKQTYVPYPINFGPDEDELYASFGEFSNSNIFVVNTKSTYKPFTIGREEGVSVSPYAPEVEKLPRIFQSWPLVPDAGKGYGGAALGHIINRVHYKKTDTAITQVYLSGWTKSATPENELVPLAKSWLKAPELAVKNGNAIQSKAYDLSQRAYILENRNPGTGSSFDCTINASKDRPIQNAAILINNWGRKAISISVNGVQKKRGTDFKYGYYSTMNNVDDMKWKDVLVIWLNISSESSVNLSIKTE